MSGNYHLVGARVDDEEHVTLIGVFNTREDAENAAIQAHEQDPLKQWIFIVESKVDDSE